MTLLLYYDCVHSTCVAYGICFNVWHKVTTSKRFITSHNVILNNCLTGIDVYAHTQLHQMAGMGRVDGSYACSDWKWCQIVQIDIMLAHFTWNTDAYNNTISGMQQFNNYLAIYFSFCSTYSSYSSWHTETIQHFSTSHMGSSRSTQWDPCLLWCEHVKYIYWVFWNMENSSWWSTAAEYFWFR